MFEIKRRKRDIVVETFQDIFKLRQSLRLPHGIRDNTHGVAKPNFFHLQEETLKTKVGNGSRQYRERNQSQKPRQPFQGMIISLPEVEQNVQQWNMPDINAIRDGAKINCCRVLE
jgi:hypothetical protein